MTKQDFLQRLEAGLAGVTPDERVAAVQYYTEYFDDAGPEKEAEVLQELGNPDTLAADIKAVSELVEEPAEQAPAAEAAPEATQPEAAPQPEAPTLTLNPQPAPTPQDPFTGMGAAPAAPQPDPSAQYRFPGGYVPPRYGQQPPQGQPYYANPQQPPQGQQYTQRAPSSGGAITALKVILIIFLCMISPAIFGVAIALLVCLCIPFIMGIAFAASALALFVLAFMVLAGSPASSLAIFGLALLFGAGGVALFWGGIKIFAVGIPAVVRGTISIFRSIFGGKRRA